jgi:hypothetical protein
MVLFSSDALEVLQRVVSRVTVFVMNDVTFWYRPVELLPHISV